MGDLAALKAAYSERHLDDAWAVYLDLRASGNPEADLFGALTARAKGDLFGARVILERAMDQRPAGRLLGQLRMSLGAVLREVGETLAAVDLFSLFLADMDQYTELAPIYTGAAHYNLGLALRQAKRLGEAVQAYEQAISEFRRENLRGYLVQALQNLAWAYCLQGMATRAEGALAEAEELCETDEDRWHQRIGRAFLEVLVGEHHRAMEMCEDITRGPATVPDDARSHAFWLAGMVARDLGRLDHAEALARQALNEALAARGENRCLLDASELLRSIIMHRQRAAP